MVTILINHDLVTLKYLNKHGYIEAEGGVAPSRTDSHTPVNPVCVVSGKRGFPLHLSRSEVTDSGPLAAGANPAWPGCGRGFPIALRAGRGGAARLLLMDRKRFPAPSMSQPGKQRQRRGGRRKPKGGKKK